ncbi:hypothetical protein P153DRAFT_22948 [Dothidotthia symphoricarpi CBS 119687]|uniref:CorA-like transporter domain-containing protein n=1 Tax=Dothidotthia symphoricarpi CBS 119687 TaxID=1392245 RepID=A0A6A6ADK1_9PLEO|nr:uncharacterized protein P153DRAFT_22948 [Dothidotthia symphoricarpi CBS 119687]KAF2129636.1 hypothetical protein P153DRAFT_22948 [Dothidotthia symphoricarpi CBS 119687]
MFFNYQQDDQEMRDACALALSASQIRACTLNCNELFSKHRDSHLVEVTRFTSNASCVPSVHSFTSCVQLSAYFDNDTSNVGEQEAGLEIYSIHQKDTWAPLSVSRDMISLIMDQYRLSSGFLQILACFRDRYLSTEEGFSGASQSLFTSSRSEYGWVYKYSEKKAVKSGNPWRIRHTGIYHLADRKRERSVLFIIHPSPSAHFKIYLQQLLQQPQARSRILSSPMLIHSMLISTHLSSWRDYLEYHETQLLQLDMKPACTSLTQSLVTFDTLKEVRAVEKNILPLEPLLASFERLMHDLEEANSVFTEANDAKDSPSAIIQAALIQFRKDAASYRRQVLYMDRRAQSTAQSVLDALNLGFQELAQSQNRNTFDMAKSAREDSVAIRAITLVTSFYLPFSFVAVSVKLFLTLENKAEHAQTMFGMNLVDFDSGSRDLVLSNQLWLYFVISVPLTALTLAYWKWRMQMYREGYMIEERRPGIDTKPLKSNSDIEMV